MHPILFHITDGFYIGTYGVMIALGLVAALVLGSWRAKQRGIPPNVMYDLAFASVVVGFVSARLLYIIVEWESFAANPMGVLLSRQGFVFLGGLIGAVGAGVVYLRTRGLPVIPVGDIAIPSVALGHAFGRIGCHFAGCCHGSVCAVEGLGIHLHEQIARDGTVFANAYTQQVYQGLIPPDAAQSLAVWPVQLIESGGLFVLTGLLLWFSSRPRRPGRTMALYLGGYAVLRFGLEFLRGDLGRGFVLGGLLSTSQAISLGLLPIAVGLWVWSRDKEPSPYSHPSLAPPLPDEDEEGGAPEEKDLRDSADSAAKKGSRGSRSRRRRKRTASSQ